VPRFLQCVICLCRKGIQFWTWALAPTLPLCISAHTLLHFLSWSNTGSYSAIAALHWWESFYTEGVILHWCTMTLGSMYTSVVTMTGGHLTLGVILHSDTWAHLVDWWLSPCRVYNSSLCKECCWLLAHKHIYIDTDLVLTILLLAVIAFLFITIACVLLLIARPLIRYQDALVHLFLVCKHQFLVGDHSITSCTLHLMLKKGHPHAVADNSTTHSTTIFPILEDCKLYTSTNYNFNTIAHVCQIVILR
jgi:hypothetical protein